MISSAGTEATSDYFANFTVAPPLFGDWAHILSLKHFGVSALGSLGLNLALRGRKAAVAKSVGAGATTITASSRSMAEDPMVKRSKSWKPAKIIKLTACSRRVWRLSVCGLRTASSFCLFVIRFVSSFN